MKQVAMATAFALVLGVAAASASGSYRDAMTNAKKTVRMTSREESPDREVHRFFEKGPDGKEFKSRELIYARR